MLIKMVRNCFCCSYFKCIIIQLCLIVSFSINAAPQQKSISESSSNLKPEFDITKQQKKSTGSSPATSWLDAMYDNVVDLFSGISIHSKTETNDIRYLQHMLDNNNLYTALEVFKEYTSFEMLALVYVNMLSAIDILDLDLRKSGLEVPAWLECYKNAGSKFYVEGLGIIKQEQIHKQIDIEDKKVIQLNNRLDCCFSMLKTLFQCPVNNFEPEPFIGRKIDNEVSRLILKLKNQTDLVSAIDLIQQHKLLDELLREYNVDIANIRVVPQYPVLAALVNWCKYNADSKINDLLESSNSWAKKEQQQIIESSKNLQPFFAYLQYNQNIEWGDGDSYLRANETQGFITQLLNTNVVKNLICEFKTVEELSVSYKEGREGLKKIYGEYAKQASLSPEQKVDIKKQTKQEKFCQDDIDEYLQDAMVQNMKDSIPGKLLSCASDLFYDVKSMFVETVMEKDKKQKVMSSWLNALDNNAAKLPDANLGHPLVMRELINIASKEKQNGNSITIVDALTKVVNQRFASLEKERVFTLLTGLERKVNKKTKSYCYQ